MTCFKTSRIVASVLLTGTLVCSVITAQAQPMMGETGMHQDHEKIHKRMGQQWEKRQAELKAKLHLASSQEDAWNSFTQSMKPPAKPVMDFDEGEIARITNKWLHVITEVLKTQDLDQIEMVKNLLWAYRKAGLAKQGEFGTANLVFKFLRNIGASTRLLDAVRHLKDQSLSI